MILKQLFSLEIVLTGSVHRKPIWRIEGFVCVCVCAECGASFCLHDF